MKKQYHAPLSNVAAPASGLNGDTLASNPASLFPFRLLLVCLLLFTYGLLFFLQFSKQSKVDYSAFYATAVAYHQGKQPYASHSLNQALGAKKLPTNLNPPIFLLISRPLGMLPYVPSMIVWSLLSFFFGLIGVLIIAQLCFERDFLIKAWPGLLFMLLSLFPVMMNIAIGQVGAFLLFFLMAGYYCYLRQRDGLAGILWGMIAAIKLFPALLFFFVLRQRRGRVFLTMAATFMLMWILPLLTDGLTLYRQYFHMLQFVYWYGDSWNASLLGFMYRFLENPADRLQSLLWLKLVYLAIFSLFIAWYWKKISLFESQSATNQAFAFTLVLMLFLSPLGWMYYFPLLLMPLILTWQTIMQEKKPSAAMIVLWLVCLFLLNFPIDYTKAVKMHGFWMKISAYSIHFYGLVGLLALISHPRAGLAPHDKIKEIIHPHLLPPLFTIIGFGLLLPLSSFILQLVTYFIP